MIAAARIAPTRPRTSDTSSAAPIWRRISAMSPRATFCATLVSRAWPTPKSTTTVIQKKEAAAAQTPNPSEPTACRTMGITMSVPAICSNRCATPAKDENAACRPRRSPRTAKGPEPWRLAPFARLAGFASRLGRTNMSPAGRVVFSLGKSGPAGALENGAFADRRRFFIVTRRGAKPAPISRRCFDGRAKKR